MECYQTCVDQGRKCTFSTSRFACSDCGKIKSAYHYNSDYCKKCPIKTDCKCAQQTCNKKHSKCWRKILAFFGYGETEERASKGSIGSEDFETQSQRSKSNASATQVSIHSQHLYEKSSKASLDRQGEGGQDKVKDIEFDITDSQNEGAKSADSSKKDNLKPEQKAKPQANKKEKSPKWTASNTSTASRGRRRKKKQQPISSSSSLSRKGLTSPKTRKHSTSSDGSHKSGKSQSCSSSISSCSPIFKKYRHKYSFLKCASFSGTGTTNPYRTSSPPAETQIGERYSRCPHRSSYICSAPFTFFTHEDCCNPFQEEVEEFETSPKRRKSGARRRSSASNCESMYSSTGSSGGRSLCNPKCPKINCKSKKCMSSGPSNRAYCQSSCLPHAKLPCRSQSFHSTLLKGPSPRAVCIPTCSPCCCACTSPCGRSRCRQPKSSSPVTCPSRKARSCPRPCACPIKSACCSPPPCSKACCPRPSQNSCVRQNKRSSGGCYCKQNCPPSCTKGCCLPCPRQFQVLPYCPNLNSFRVYTSLPKCIKGSHCPCPPEMCSCVKPKNKLSQKINSSMLASLCTPMCCSGFSASYVKSKQGDAICQQLLNKYSFSKPISKCDVQLCTGSSFIPSTPSNRSSGCARNCCFSAGSFVHSMPGKPYGGGGGGCKSCLPNDGQALGLGVPKAAEPADNYTHSRKPSSPEDKRKKQEQTILFNSAPCNKEPRCEFFLAPYCLRKTGPRSPVREYMDKLNAKPNVIKSVHDDCSEKRQSHESDKSQKCEGKNKQEVSKAKKKRKPKTRKQPAAPPTDENASALVGVKGGDDTTEEYPELDNLGAFIQMQSRSVNQSVSRANEKSSNNNYSNDMNSSSAMPMKLQFTDRRSYSFSRSTSLGNSSYGYKANYGSYGSLSYRSRERPNTGPYFTPTNFYQKSYAWRKEIENIYKEIETFRKRQPPNVNINAISTPAYMSSYYSRKRTLESTFYENLPKAKLYDQLEKEIEERIQEIKKNKTFEGTSESSALRRRFTYPELMSEEVVSETLKMLKERQQQRSGEDKPKDSAHSSYAVLVSDKEALNTNNGKCSANQKSARAVKRIAPKSTQIGAKSTQAGAKSTHIGAPKSAQNVVAKTAQSTAQKSYQSFVSKNAKVFSKRPESAKRSDEAKPGLPSRALNETGKNKHTEQTLGDASSTNKGPDKNLLKPAPPLPDALGDSFLQTPAGESNVDLPVHQSTLVMFQDLFYRFGEQPNVRMVSIDPPNMKVGHSEPANVQVGHIEPPNVKVGHIETPNVKVGHIEPPNVKVGHSESVNMQVGHIEPTNVKVGHSEPTNVQVGHSESTNVQVGHSELANLKEGHSESVNVQAVHSELANLKAGQSEPATVKTGPQTEGKFERYELAEENISKNKAVDVLEDLVLQDTSKLCCRDSYLCASANSSACNMTPGTSSTTITMVGSKSNHSNMSLSNLDLLPSDHVRPLLVRNNSCDRRHKIVAECKNFYDNMSSSTLGNSDSQLKTCSFKYHRVMSPHSLDTESLASLGKLKYIPDSESSLSLSSPRKNCNNGSCVDPAKSESSHMDVLQGSSVDPDSSANPTPVSQVGRVKSTQSLSMFQQVEDSDTELIRSARNLYYSRLRTGQEGDGTLPLETKSGHLSEISKSLEGMAVPSHSTVCDPISDGMVDFIRHYGTPV